MIFYPNDTIEHIEVRSHTNIAILGHCFRNLHLYNMEGYFVEEGANDSSIFDARGRHPATYETCMSNPDGKHLTVSESTIRFIQAIELPSLTLNISKVGAILIEKPVSKVSINATEIHSIENLVYEESEYRKSGFLMTNNNISSIYNLHLKSPGHIRHLISYDRVSENS